MLPPLVPSDSTLPRLLPRPPRHGTSIVPSQYHPEPRQEWLSRNQHGGRRQHVRRIGRARQDVALFFVERRARLATMHAVFHTLIEGVSDNEGSERATRLSGGVTAVVLEGSRPVGRSVPPGSTAAAVFRGDGAKRAVLASG